MHRKGHYEHIPSTVIPALKRVGVAIFFIGGTAIMSDIFPIEYVITDEFAAKSFVLKLLILVGTLKTKLFTYYTGFSLMESGAIASGLSYNGLDENK